MSLTVTILSFYFLLISTQYIDIWFDDMALNNGWTVNGDDIDFSIVSSACFDNPCTRTAISSIIQKATDISQFTSIQLQLDISNDAMAADDTCDVYYAHGTEVNKQIVRSYHGVNKDVMLYPQQTFNLPLSPSSITIWIFLQANTARKGVCYWDNVYLRGTPVTNSPTATVEPSPHPTQSPVAALSPTINPTYFPTKSPSISLTKLVATRSTTNIASFYPTMEPTPIPSRDLHLKSTQIEATTAYTLSITTYTELTPIESTSTTLRHDKEDVILINTRYIFTHYMLYIVCGLSLIAFCCIVCIVCICYNLFKKRKTKRTEPKDDGPSLAVQLAAYTPGEPLSTLSNRSKKKTTATFSTCYTLEGPKDGVDLPESTMSSHRNPVLLKDIAGSFRPEYAIEVIRESDGDSQNDEDMEQRKRSISTSNASMYGSHEQNKVDKVTSPGEDTMEINMGEDDVEESNAKDNENDVNDFDYLDHKLLTPR